MPTERQREVAKQIVNKYRQMNEVLLTNVEFLEARIAAALSEAEKRGMERAAEIASKFIVFDDPYSGTRPDLHEIAQAILTEAEKEKV